jgi:hypothetical protein
MNVQEQINAFITSQPESKRAELQDSALLLLKHIH